MSPVVTHVIMSRNGSCRGSCCKLCDNSPIMNHVVDLVSGPVISYVIFSCNGKCCGTCCGTCRSFCFGFQYLSELNIPVTLNDFVPNVWNPDPKHWGHRFLGNNSLESNPPPIPSRPKNNLTLPLAQFLFAFLVPPTSEREWAKNDHFCPI